MQSGGEAFHEGSSLLRFLDTTSYAYTIGEDLLVAPVLEAGGEVSLRFPDDEEWVYLFDSEISFTGGTTQKLTVPLDEFPVFLRAGSALADDAAMLLEG
jgi:alpha-glucosidase (family GH31 glycosyl hydrolase)